MSVTMPVHPAVKRGQNRQPMYNAYPHLRFDTIEKAIQFFDEQELRKGIRRRSRDKGGTPLFAPEPRGPHRMAL